MSVADQVLTLEQKRELVREILDQRQNGPTADKSRAAHRNAQVDTRLKYTHQTLDTFSSADTIAYGEIDRFKPVGRRCQYRQ